MIIFIHGDDSFRSWHKLQDIKKKFKEKVDITGSNIVVMEGDDFDINLLREQILSPALFSKERMIIIKNLLQQGLSKKNQEQVIELIDKADENIVVFWEFMSDSDQLKKIIKTQLYQRLNREKFAQEFKNLSAVQLEKWVINHAKQEGTEIKQAVARSLISLTGNDLWHVYNELNKLILYKKDKEITSKDLELLVEARVSDNIWLFTDSLAKNNKFQALKLFKNQLLVGSDPSELFGKMVWQFRILILVKEVLDKNDFTSSEIAKELGIHPYVVQKSLSLVKNFTLPQLKRIYQLLLKTDIQMKTGTKNQELLLDLLILNI